MTYGDKEIVVVPAANRVGFQLKLVGGGELPEALSGLYTGADVAEAAVRTHLDNNKVNRKKSVAE